MKTVECGQIFLLACRQLQKKAQHNFIGQLKTSCFICRGYFYSHLHQFLNASPAHTPRRAILHWRRDCCFHEEEDSERLTMSEGPAALFEASYPKQTNKQTKPSTLMQNTVRIYKKTNL